MRRIEKKADSLILKENLSYQKRDGKRIAEILREEQNGICAYTEEYLGRADKADVEHFDPTLKPTDNDSYQNWFLVKAQWNTEKGRTARWLLHQPLLYPTAEDFELRILYDKGSYILADENDIEARNLRTYLKLDDEGMIQQRVHYIDRMQEDIVLSGLSNQEFVNWRLSTPKYQNTIFYIRAVQEELQVRVNFDLLKTK